MHSLLRVVSGTAELDTYYHGVRRYPYSVDFRRNPLTLRMLAHDAVPPADVPIFDWRGRSRFNTEIHSAGEIWATSLWQCYQAVLRRRPHRAFAEVRALMAEYVVAGMKATPANPTFTEARDALLAVIKASNRGDFRVCRNAMAVRGLGAGAIAPPHTSRDLEGVQESFSRSNVAVSFIEAQMDDRLSSRDNDGILDAGEEGYLTDPIFGTFKGEGVVQLSEDGGVTNTCMTAGPKPRAPPPSAERSPRILCPSPLVVIVSMVETRYDHWTRGRFS